MIPQKQNVQTACKPVETPPQHRMMASPRERGPVRVTDILHPLIAKLAEKPKTK